MPLLKDLLTALGFGAVPAAVFAVGRYADPATLAEYGMPVSLAAMGIILVGFVELTRARA